MGVPFVLGFALQVGVAPLAKALEPVESATHVFVKSGSTPGTGGNIRLQGVVRPVEVADLHFVEVGQVSVIHANEGMRVKKMDPILSLSHRGALINYKSAKLQAERSADLRLAELTVQQRKTEWEMIEQAFSKNAVNPLEREFKKLELEQAKATLLLKQEERAQAVLAMESAEADLDRFTLKAPFDGVVTHVRAKVGKSVSIGDTMVTVANLGRLEVEMHLPVSYFGSIEQGGSAILVAQAPVNRQLDATATFVSSVIDPTSSTFRAIFTIDNSDGSLPSGFCVELQ
jgi:RND family efflux transporter MFP subunit